MLFSPDPMLLPRRAVVAGGCAMWLSSAKVARAAASATGYRSINLWDRLDSSEREQIISGRNAFDVARRLRECLAAVPEGGVVDATMLRGVALLAGNPFSGLAGRNVTLQTGEVIFEKAFSLGSLALPSDFTWACAGTTIRPSGTFKRILSDAAPGIGMVETGVWAGHCSGQVGDDYLTLTSVSDAFAIQRHGRIAVFGIEPDRSIFHSIDRTLSPETSSFKFMDNVAGTIEGSNVHLLIDNEIIRGTISGGVFRCLAGGRGYMGTVASAHSRGARAQLLVSALFTVLAVEGRRVFLNSPLLRGFTGGQYRVGSVNTRVSGKLTVDGGDQKGVAGAFFNCMASTLSTGLQITGHVQLRASPHGGFFGYGCTQSDISLQEIADCGRSDVGIGGGLWLFARADRNQVRVGRITRCHGGVFIDNKSFGVSYYGLDGPCKGNRVDVALVEASDVACEIDGSTGNSVHIGFADVRQATVIMDNGRSQTVVPPKTQGNTVSIGAQKFPRPNFGDALLDNSIKIGH